MKCEQAGIALDHGNLAAGSGHADLRQLRGDGDDPRRRVTNVRRFVADSTFKGNSSGHGGAIAVDDSVLSLRRSTVADNTASLTGGGVYANAYVHIDRSTISGNTAQNVGGASLGGPGVTQPLEITRSTISGNTGTGNNPNGAGLYLQSDADVFYSTITHNTEHSTSCGGAGILLAGRVGLYLASSIVAGNGWDSGGGSGTLLKGSDIGWTSHGVQPYIMGVLSLIGYSTEPLPSSFIVIGSPVYVVFPGLGALADNGGPTNAHLPHATSPAIDAGDIS